MLFPMRDYIGISVFWDKDGETNINGEIIPSLTPTCLYLEGGGVYVVDRINRDGIMPGRESGGYGVRYTARTSCEHEENYGKVFYVYLERYGTVGRWRCGDEYVAADVMWDTTGRITPTCIYPDGHKYLIQKKSVRQYAMSTRKSDGSGRRYIVTASCRELRDYNREFALMLENGGEMVGRWFCEDADLVEKRKMLYYEAGFDEAIIRYGVEENMGVGHVCARYQSTVEIEEALRDWYRKRDHPLISREEFEKRIKRGEILPTDYAPVFVTDEDGKIDTQIMRWGLRRTWTKTPLYNAKIETVTQKDTFKGIAQNRCIIPSGGFYEWLRENGKATQKYVFRMPDAPKLYMAGLYEPVEDGSNYTILTTRSNSSVDIHDRMPVVLRHDECKAWLGGQIGLEAICDRESVKLLKEAV